MTRGDRQNALIKQLFAFCIYSGAAKGASAPGTNDLVYWIKAQP